MKNTVINQIKTVLESQGFTGTSRGSMQLETLENGRPVLYRFKFQDISVRVETKAKAPGAKWRHIKSDFYSRVRIMQCGSVQIAGVKFTLRKPGFIG